MSASACYMIASMTSWPQSQVTNFSIDLLVTALIYQQVKPNFSIKLLVVGSFLRWFFIVPAFVISTAYTPSSPEGFCDWIVGFADIARLSNSELKVALANAVLTGVSLVIGAIFRLFRNPCRYQFLNGDAACWAGTGAIWDNLTVVNVIFFEMLLLAFMIIKIQAFVKSKVDSTGMFKKFYDETVMRLVVLVPLGICEALAYIVQQTPGAPTWLNWVLTIAVYCRQFNPVIISVMIVSAKLNHSKTVVSKGKSMTTGQSNIKTKEKSMDN
ncbi:hypothetical protein HDV06_002971 [Boothiomyces sp. JEL0866]|nr:hypothetical protein HDV06_002971 [Boothiomyces sp. JEL0866]